MLTITNINPIDEESKHNRTGGPGGTADFVLFHVAMLGIYSCAWLRCTEPADMQILERSS